MFLCIIYYAMFVTIQKQNHFIPALRSINPDNCLAPLSKGFIMMWHVLVKDVRLRLGTLFYLVRSTCYIRP